MSKQNKVGLKDLLGKKQKLSRARHKKAELTNDQLKEFRQGQIAYEHFWNFGLKYLIEHFAKNNFYKHFPQSSAQRQYLVRNMKRYAIKEMQKHEPGVKKSKLMFYFDSQSILKLYEELITNFLMYRRKQYQLYSDPAGPYGYIGDKHKNPRSYGRISFVHDDQHFKTLLFKANGGQSVKILNQFTIKVPKLGKIHLKQALASLKNKKISEVQVQEYRPGKFQVNIIWQHTVVKDVSADELNKTNPKILSTDWNMHADRIFVHNHGDNDILPAKIDSRLKQIDQKLRHLDNLLDGHRKDDNRRVTLLSVQEQNLYNKKSNIVKQWMINTVKSWLSTGHDIFPIENLSSFTMRLAGKSSRKNRNINKKLAQQMPGMFKKVCESLIPDAGKLLIEIDSWDTSKTCSWCGYINHDLKVGTEHWYCPNPKCPFHYMEHDRDFNAAMNILLWALNPHLHAKWRRHKDNNKFKYLKQASDLVTYF